MRRSTVPPCRRRPCKARWIVAFSMAISRNLAMRGLRKLGNLSLLVALILMWQAISVFMLDNTTRALLPPPTAIARAASDLVSSGELFRHLQDSLKRELVAFIWATS